MLAGNDPFVSAFVRALIEVLSTKPMSLYTEFISFLIIPIGIHLKYKWIFLYFNYTNIFNRC